MLWLLVALIAYFLLAIAMVVDKTLLKKDIPDPIVYTFYVSMLGALVILIFLIIIPFTSLTIVWPNLLTLLISFLAGVAFTWALILMYTALKKDDATRVGPMIGGLVPIFVFILAWFILQESLTCTQYIAFLFLIIGSILISLDFSPHGAISWLKKKFGLHQKLALPQIRRAFWLALPAAGAFGVSHVLTKYVYMQIDFVSGFVWTRLGAFLTVLLLLLIPHNYKALKKDLKKNKKHKKSAQKTGGRFLFGQTCGGAGTLLVQYAMFLGSVSLIQALQGTQYVFLFLMVIALTIFVPKLLKEDISKEIFWQKVIAVIFIFIGLWFITM